MAPTLTPIKAWKCTYKDCAASFDTEKDMKKHKKNSDEHDYCAKCDEDFDSYDDLSQHKAFRPDNHGKACRVCGEEFKSEPGLRRHIELTHKVDQKLACIGCDETFYRASLLIEHLEFGHCSKITADEFQGHIVHKHLITELLKGGINFNRFMAKISRSSAGIDHEEEGGVAIIEENADQALNVEYKALEPETHPPEVLSPEAFGPYPPLPSQSQPSELGAGLSNLSINDAESTDSGSTLKPWASKNASKTLFPTAKPTPAPPSEYSMTQHDQQMEQEHGINIMSSRFWDPKSVDWSPERFYDAVIQKYYCPFICEQTFIIPSDLNLHILHEHRITRMKCPKCLKNFKSCTALMSHCESRGSKCTINKADDFNVFLDRLTGGFLGVKEETRPEFLQNPSVVVTNPLTGRVERYTPPVASYLQYAVTRPVDYKQPVETTRIGGPSEELEGERGVRRKPIW